MELDEQLKEARSEVARRADALQRLYVEMQNLVQAQMNEQRTLATSELKDIKTKLGELQSLQLSLLRAEETLYDRLRFKTDEARPDYDEIRRGVGRSLDRLRSAIAAERVSSGAVRASD